MKVAVLKGGRSLEREVSLRSASNVEAALRRLGHTVLPVDADQRLVKILREERPDVAFVAMHGKGGEDGTVQELLEILEIPYTGSGVLACQRSMDKAITKAIFENAGIRTPAWFAFSEDAFRELGAADTMGDIMERLGMPLVVKPVRQGSALGISVIKDPAHLPQALLSALSYDDRVMLEAFVSGRELSVSVLGTDDPRALPVVEAVPESDFYDFESRYTPGATELRAPAPIPDDVAAEASALALNCYRAIGCRGFGRIDMMLDPDGALWVLELNAIPGMTDTSLLPAAARAADMDFDEFVERALALADLGG